MPWGVAQTFSVALPIGWRMIGIQPTIVWGKPLDGPAEAMRTLAQRNANLGTSLDVVAVSLQGDAWTTTVAFAETCTQMLKLIDDAEKTAAAVKAEHLPQAIAAMEQAALTCGFN